MLLGMWGSLRGSFSCFIILSAASERRPKVTRWVSGCDVWQDSTLAMVAAAGDEGWDIVMCASVKAWDADSDSKRVNRFQLAPKDNHDSI